MESIILGMIVAHSKARITRTIKNVNNVDNKRFTCRKLFEFSNNFFSSQFVDYIVRTLSRYTKNKGKADHKNCIHKVFDLFELVEKHK